MSNRAAPQADEITRNVQRNVRIFMAARGLKGPAVCEALHMSKQTLSDRLNGPTTFGTAEMVALTRLLDVSFEVLVADPGTTLRSRWGSHPSRPEGFGGDAAVLPFPTDLGPRPAAHEAPPGTSR